ncbi:hypothetical protein N0V90_012738 [Kalmusia sp. IMI 367209]|nr:hypothetical protein N0V90_012738 [Kalmusia sp. IMI 367209]
MGLAKDLHLRNNDFSNIATFLFVALLCFEVPNIYFLQVVPAAKWLGANVMLWGVATACGAAAHNYQTLLVSRIFLGIFEATIGPSLLLISSQWYTKSEQAPRFCLWYCGLGVGQIVGGAISYGFQKVEPGTGLASWRIMFVVLGCLTISIGLCTFIFLPDTPMKARWLTDNEKVMHLEHVSVNRTGIQDRKFRSSEIIEALLDPQVYLLVLSVILDTGSESSLTDGLGSLPASSLRVLAGIYLVNAVVAPLAVFYNWTAANIGGATKRAFTAAIVSGSFSIGNIIGPQTFQARDAPQYRPAKLAILGTQAGCAFVTFMLFLYYVYMNRKRVESIDETEGRYMDPEVWARLTDRENSKFRYVY